MTVAIEDPDTRRRELARIHILAKERGLDREAYEQMLWSIARVKSSGDLDSAGRKKVLRHLGGRPARSRGVRAAADRAPLIAKVRALLGPEREDAYALGILKKMYRDRAPAALEWASAEQLRKVVAALNYDRRRHAGGAEATK